MTAFTLLRCILSHPLNRGQRLKATKRFLKWQASARFSLGPQVVPFVDKTVLAVSRGMVGATQNIYCGLADFEEMAFLLHFLRPEDLFLDVGANVGVYTVLASGVCGCKTMAFEPVPSTFRALERNVALNGLSGAVSLFSAAVGQEQCRVKMVTGMDAENHVVIGAATTGTEVDCVTLDDEMGVQKPRMVKMDIEGFELPALRGFEKGLQNPTLGAILVELNGSGKRYGFDETEVVSMLNDHGFLPFHYNPWDRSLSRAGVLGANVLFLREIPGILDRFGSAPKRQVKLLPDTWI